MTLIFNDIELLRRMHTLFKLTIDQIHLTVVFNGWSFSCQLLIADYGGPSRSKVDIMISLMIPRDIMIFIPNRTFLVRFGGISGEFGRAMVCILARRSRAKIPMVRPNEPDMLPKRTKKGAIRYLPYPNSSYKTRRYFFSYRVQSRVVI